MQQCFCGQRKVNCLCYFFIVKTHRVWYQKGVVKHWFYISVLASEDSVCIVVVGVVQKVYMGGVNI